MPRYIDADILKKHGWVLAKIKTDKNGVITKIMSMQIDDAPTADVVQKSEPDRLVDKWIGSGELTPDEKTLRLIEALRDEAKRYERYYFNHEYDKLIAEAKAEVARGIFEEIEKVMYNRPSIPFLGADIRLCIAELKKKYREGE